MQEQVTLGVLALALGALAGLVLFVPFVALSERVDAAAEVTAEG